MHYTAFCKANTKCTFVCGVGTDVFVQSINIALYLQSADTLTHARARVNNLQCCLNALGQSNSASEIIMSNMGKNIMSKQKI